MNVPKLVQLVDCNKHLTDVEKDMPHGKNGTCRVIEERAEIASRDVFHGQVDEVVILEGVEEAYKPRGLRSC